MKKFDRIIKRSGIKTAGSLVLLLLIVLLAYHIVTVFGLNYFFTGNDLTLGSIGESRTYGKSTVDTARMISAGSETSPAVFAVLCPDQRSSFILETASKNAEKINKKLEKGKKIKLRGIITTLDEDTKNKYTPYLQQYGYETNLLRGNKMTHLTFADYIGLHPILNSITCVILLLILFFIIRSLMYGSYGKIKSNERKFGYELDDIRNDFELAEKYGGLSIGKKFIYVTKNPAAVVAADDVILAYLHLVVEQAAVNFIPLLKHKLYSVVMVDRKGGEYEVRYPNENKANDALMAISRFGHITISPNDEFRNSVRTSLKTFVERADDKKKELAQLQDK